MRHLSVVAAIAASLALVSFRAGSGEAVALSLDAAFALELHATWEPLTDTVYGFQDSQELVSELAPAAASRTYDAELFGALLPPAPVAVGDSWPLDAAAALPFLRQLHLGATDQLHHGRGAHGISAPGAHAVLRAVGPDQAEVLLRVHAEFVLEGDGQAGNSSWITPAQFEGRLLLDRSRGVVTSFSLALPDQSANVDVNIRTEQHGIIADIGRFPRMEVASRDTGTAPVFSDEIDDTAARDILARHFYPLAQVDWLPLDEALRQSRQTGRPLHVVLLFGSLTDESC